MYPEYIGGGYEGFSLYGNKVEKTTLIQYIHVRVPELLISFEAWAKLVQKWLVCAPLKIHLEPINKEVIPLVTI